MDFGIKSKISKILTDQIDNEREARANRTSLFSKLGENMENIRFLHKKKLKLISQLSLTFNTHGLRNEGQRENL
jgi:hypothetical protein